MRRAQKGQRGCLVNREKGAAVLGHTEPGHEGLPCLTGECNTFHLHQTHHPKPVIPS